MASSSSSSTSNPSSSSMLLSYASLRSSLDDDGDASSNGGGGGGGNNGGGIISRRVEVNQRALIDKILARYASAGAVYRELLQNSNDAEADTAEIYFTTSSASSASTSSTSSSNNIVQQVLYRNNGMPFRPQDWSRLQKIAEGNPDVNKIGAFGVGAYTIFSICEEPVIISGKETLAFVWKGDALWTKSGPNNLKNYDTQWTTFILPSRDPYPLPDMVEFGEFLTASLTFTASLRQIRVFVNQQEKLTILKTLVQEPRPVATPKNTSSSSALSLSSWWKSKTDEANVVTPHGVFYLPDKAILESVYRITVILLHNNNKNESETASMDARYISAMAKTKIPPDMERRMERVTKKQPPPQVTVQIFLNAQQQSNHNNKKRLSKAERIVQSFSPSTAGKGRIFIGFRTSQTTGLAAHLAAPFVPTVEREAMDLQDPTLRLFNTELLELAGILLRLTLEDTMYNVIDVAWKNHAPQRLALEQQLAKQKHNKNKKSNTAAAGESTSSSTSTTTTATNTTDEDGEEGDSGEDATFSGGGLMGFARFMARGVKKKIVSVVNTVEEILLVDDTAEYLQPVDPLPLSDEEEQAIVLMQSFCPQQSTPDPLVGTCIAQGFARCLPHTAPPVLTRSGVVPGTATRLPSHGIESFVHDNVVRAVVYKSAEEYHTLIAPCQLVNLEDLIHTLSNPSTILEMDKLVFLIKWWVKYSRVDPRGAGMYGYALKQAIQFYPDKNDDNDDDNDNEDVAIRSSSSAATKTPEKSRRVMALQDILYYIDRNSVLSKKVQQVPLPETVLHPLLQEQIGDSALSDVALEQWFAPLPMEIWAKFVSQDPRMDVDNSKNNNINSMEHQTFLVNVLGILCKEYSNRSTLAERVTFGGFLASILADKRCIPYDDDNHNNHNKNSSKDGKATTTGPGADRPSELYLQSAELKAFDGIGAFRKVSALLSAEGVTEDFLLALGVRKSVSVDFLFRSLDSLKWSNDPKPLVEYLRSATLTRDDLAKLSRSKYLPAENDNTLTYAPSELYLPNLELRIFPFLRVLRWPSESEVSERSENGRFLVQLGVKTMPPLLAVLSYVTEEVNDGKKRLLCLDFLADRLGPKGIYHKQYSSLSSSARFKYQCLPCVKRDLLESEELVTELQSPVSCFSDPACVMMGFPVIDYRLGDRAKLYGNFFQCPTEPQANDLLRQLLQIVAKAKAMQQSSSNNDREVADKIEKALAAVFGYLSHRSSDFTFSALNALRRESFIPCLVDGKIEWFRVDQVFFRSTEQEQKDQLTADLFQSVDFSPFLATAGVKQEATTKDLFQLMLASPQDVLNSLGSESKYLSLLRRIAANPPFSHVTAEIRNAPFLIAYTLTYQDSDSPEKGTYELAKASDIYIVDNSFFGRMFPVKRAPAESDLENFYYLLGSSYISKSVDRRFEVVGKPLTDTSLTKALKERVLERSPLLVSPSVTSRPLVSNASSLFSESRFSILEASKLMAVYSLNGVTRRNPTTCFSRALNRSVNGVYVVSDFDWFDVGYAIGDLILKRCQLEDAFFISSLLEAPVEQLRARGFPVDRIVKPEPPPRPPPPPPPPPPPQPTIAAAPKPMPGVVEQVASPQQASMNSSRPEAVAAASRSTATEKEPTNIIAQSNPDPSRAASLNDASNKKGPNDGVDAGQKQPPSLDSKKNADPTANVSKEGFESILRQMFPNVDASYIRGRLGDKPTLEDVQRIAEEISSNLPHDDSDSATVESSTHHDLDDASQSSQKLRNKGGGLRKKLGRAFNGLRASAPGGSSYGGGLPQFQQQHGVETRKPVPEVSDAMSHKYLEDMLQSAVKSSSHVNERGIHSHDTTLTSIPEGLDRGETCEMIPGHSIKPFTGPNGNSKTQNGIRVFSSRGMPESESFLQSNQKSVESFSLVLERLCSVFGLSTSTVAIFHEPSGGVIAFNANRALHFNVRFFHALHFQPNKQSSPDCYSYWFVTMAHELAHHMVSAHNKEHGFYTESYITMYLPKLIGLLSNSNN